MIKPGYIIILVLGAVAIYLGSRNKLKRYVKTRPKRKEMSAIKKEIKKLLKEQKKKNRARRKEQVEVATRATDSEPNQMEN